MKTSILRPGLLVSLRTKVTGNVSYKREDIEADHLTDDGGRKAKWETERKVKNAAEAERAEKTRAKASSMVRGLCIESEFGLLCPLSERGRLIEATEQARALAEEFNATATITRISVNIITGEIAQSDVEAIRSINFEVRSLLGAMETGLKNLDVKVVRDAADKARKLGTMLTSDASSRIAEAIDVARSAARRIVKAGEGFALEIDQGTLATIKGARMAFLDLDEQAEVKAPVSLGRAIEMEPMGPEVLRQADEELAETQKLMATFWGDSQPKLEL